MDELSRGNGVHAVRTLEEFPPASLRLAPCREDHALGWSGSSWIESGGLLVERSGDPDGGGEDDFDADGDFRGRLLCGGRDVC